MIVGIQIAPSEGGIARVQLPDGEVYGVSIEQLPTQLNENDPG